MKKRLLAVSILLLNLVLLVGCNKEKRQIDFDSETWKTEDEYERYRMLESLEERYELVGMSCTEIEDLLGEKSLLYYEHDIQNNSDFYWAYVVKYDDVEGNIDLLIHFEDGIVTEYRPNQWEWSLTD